MLPSQAEYGAYFSWTVSISGASLAIIDSLRHWACKRGAHGLPPSAGGRQHAQDGPKDSGLLGPVFTESRHTARPNGPSLRERHASPQRPSPATPTPTTRAPAREAFHGFHEPTAPAVLQRGLFRAEDCVGHNRWAIQTIPAAHQSSGATPLPMEAPEKPTACHPSVQSRQPHASNRANFDSPSVPNIEDTGRHGCGVGVALER